MSIDLEKAKEEFIKYTEKYDLENVRIKGKQTHSLRVMEISKQIAEGLELSQEEVQLATLIGLLHDIARFEQFTQYHTYRDMESFDHGDYGVHILEGEIRKYIETSQYDYIIKNAVKYHNKYKIPEDLPEKEMLFSRIVRDADKLDILYESVIMFWVGKEKQVEESKISQDILEQFKDSVQIKNKKDESPIDDVIKVIAFIFDMNFKTSFQILKEGDYINKTLDRYNLKDEYTKKAVDEIRKIANDYVERQAKG